MPIQKNQHYVPKVYLNKFSGYEGRKAIDIFSIPHKKIIKKAPIKNQCSRDYFYGHDLEIENKLSALESDYACVVNNLLSNGGLINDIDDISIRLFLVFQHQRTEAAVRKNIIANQKMNAAIGSELAKEFQDMDFDHETALRISLASCKSIFDCIEDMCLVVLKNETSLEFITSDDPVVLTNKFYTQKLRSANFGFASSGLLIYMPISPSFAVLLYDRDVYRIQDKNGIFRIFKESDVICLNDGVFIKASYNIYFAGGSSSDEMMGYMSRNSKQRSMETLTVSVSVLSDKIGNEEYYRIATEEDVKGLGPFVIGLHTTHSAPSSWPSFLNYSISPKTYFDGSAAGHLRAQPFLMSGAPIESSKGSIRHIMMGWPSL